MNHTATQNGLFNEFTAVDNSEFIELSLADVLLMEDDTPTIELTEEDIEFINEPLHYDDLGWNNLSSNPKSDNWLAQAAYVRSGDLLAVVRRKGFEHSVAVFRDDTVAPLVEVDLDMTNIQDQVARFVNTTLSLG